MKDLSEKLRVLQTNRLDAIRILKRLQVDNGDILIIRCDSMEILQAFAEQFDILNQKVGESKNVLMVREQDIDIVFERADESEMRSLGWMRVPVEDEEELPNVYPH